MPYYRHADKSCETKQHELVDWEGRSKVAEGLGQRGDVLLALSTSGRSPNILAALHTARQRGLGTVGFTGSKGEALRSLCDYLLVAPSDDTPVVQQIHLTVAHGICDQIEQTLLREASRK